MNSVEFLIILLFSVCDVYSKPHRPQHPGGDLTGACVSMVPGHGVEPQSVPFPYDITFTNSEISSGESVEIFISGKEEEKFKGFFVQARQNDLPVGTFTEADEVATINCPTGTKNTAVQTSIAEKSSVKLLWTAPDNLKGSVDIYATIVKAGAEFWVKQHAGTINVS